MRIIGIYLKEGISAVIKNIQPGWYPFGNYAEPTPSNEFPWSDTAAEDELLSQLYKSAALRPFPDSFKISVSCIVGKNGSGKTTLLELLFRIINNFAYKVFQGDTDLPVDRKLTYAGGFAATLYFETDNRFGAIYNSYKNIDFCYLSGKKKSEIKKGEFEKYLEQKEMNRILNRFFYTICSNYSIYSFNQDDYDTKRISMPEGESSVDGSWIRGLLHKNDGYQTPLVITPYRDSFGNININNEKKLAKQRLSTMALLLASQKKDFLKSYKPSYIEYRYDDKAAQNYNEKYSLVCREHIPLNDRDQLRTLLTTAWTTIIEEEYKSKKKISNAVKDGVLSYLVYKSLKICVNYRSYGEILGERPLTPTERTKVKGEYDSILYPRGEDPQKRVDQMCFFDYTDDTVFELVNKIKNEHSHITFKIDQMLNFIKSGLLKGVAVQEDSPEYLTSVKRYRVEHFIENGLKYYNQNRNEEDAKTAFGSYDEVFNLLPPPIFKWELYFSSNDHPVDAEMTNGISLNSLSSGEKQLLQNLSYIMYHIYNIESIVTDKYRNRYHHINIVLDEAELYYHPDFQREMLAKAIGFLSTFNIDARKIRSVNFMIVTHSPFVLSDVPRSKILYLDNGTRKINDTDTFSANIHELLYHQFYIERPMGEVAFKVQDQIVAFFNERKKATEDEWGLFKEKLTYYRSIIEYIGEPYLKTTLSMMLDTIVAEIEDKDVKKGIISKEVERLEKRITELKKQLPNEES